jgi:hypothetical protein
MKSLQALFVTLLLCSSLAVQATENGSGDPRYTIQNPPAYAMIGDLLIARPLLVAATVLGAGCLWCHCRLPRWVAGWAMRAGAGGGSGESCFCAVSGVYGEGFEQRE